MWSVHSGPIGRNARRSRSLLPMVFEFEERVVPSTYVATQFGDGVSVGTLRWAIQQADSTLGSNTVMLRPGVYALTLTSQEGGGSMTGALPVQGNVTIRGAGAGSTQIVATGLGDRVFHVLGGNVRFAGLTISGGTATQGGGMLIDAGNVTITNCVLTGNTAAATAGGNAQGGAIYQGSGTLLVTGTTMSGNSALGSGATPGALLSLRSGEGGGVYLNTGVTARFTGDNFSGNTAQGGDSADSSFPVGGLAAGGAVRAIGDSVTIVRTTFRDNRAVGGHGFNSDLIIQTGGAALGGAISIQSTAKLVLNQSTLVDNQAIGGTGGNGPFWGFGGEGQGGALSVTFHSTVSATTDQVIGNLARGGAGGLGGVEPYPDTDHGGGEADGGGIYLSFSNGSCIHVTFASNLAQGGRGGDGDYGGMGGNAYGGALDTLSQGTFSSSSFTVRGSLLSGNQSIGGAGGFGSIKNGHGGKANGGAGVIAQGTAADFIGTNFNGNRAVGETGANGGALVALDSTISLARVGFNSNLALGGASSYGSGGAIGISMAATLTAKNVNFTANQAVGGAGAGAYDGGSGQGGAVFGNGGTASFVNAMFRNNLAQGGGAGTGLAGNGLGGAIQTVEAELTIASCQFLANQAIGGAIGNGDASDGSSGQGGALNSDPASSLTIGKSTIRRNKALGRTGYGGGIYLAGEGPATLTGVKFAGNVATTAGPDIYGPES